MHRPWSRALRLVTLAALSLLASGSTCGLAVEASPGGGSLVAVDHVALPKGVRVHDLEADDSNGVWVLVSDSDTTRLGRLAGNGELTWIPTAGLGVLRGVRALFRIPGGTASIGAWDVRANSLLTIGISGDTSSVRRGPAPQSNVLLDPEAASLVNPHRIEVIGETLVLPWLRGEIVRPRDYWHTALLAASKEEPTPRVIVAFARAPAEATPSNSDAELRASPHIPRWASCEQSLVWYDPRDGRVFWVSTVGEVLDAQLIVSPGGDRVPTGYDLFCSSRERALLRVSDPATNPAPETAEWLLVDRAGAIASVQLPAQFSPRTRRGNRIYGIRRGMSEGDGLMVVTFPEHLDSASSLTPRVVP